ncbi:MAG: phytanoyl-CoA dioxygenase family protein [Acidobacteria bacterium]|nr:phytanoyl-CoA dioxygenase family protein [Acidobacteriota bacterium]
MNVCEQKSTYDRDGFLIVEDLLPEQRMQELERALNRYYETIVPLLPATDIVYETDAATGARTGIRNLWRMEKHSPYFDQLGRQREICDLVGTLVNGEPVLMAVELFAKPARVGSAVPYHQDNGYFNLTPPDALTLWLALDDSTEENGCVYYARGSHRQGLLPHKASLVPGNSWGLAEQPDPNQPEEVPGVVRRSSAILHHCCLLHRSERNLSGRPRRGLLMVYKAAHCQIEAAGMEKYLAASEASHAAGGESKPS